MLYAVDAAWAMSDASVVPSASPRRRPAAATPAKFVFPARLLASAACPCRDIAILGIQYPIGLEAAPSHSVPACTSAGVVVRLPISYQREPLRPPVFEP